MLELKDFHFNLPPELIAKYPLDKRSHSRLLALNNQGIKHLQFYNVLDLINDGDLIIFNDTKVIPARIFGKKTSGGKVEILVEKILDDERILAQVRASKAPKVGDYLLFEPNTSFEVLSRKEQFYELKLTENNKNILDIIEAIGEIPLPPYLHRAPNKLDQERYQTVYAKHKGSIAAPTAGLHFDHELLEKLRAKKVNFAYLTLHIGAGTFAPIRSEKLTDHQMHAEYIHVSQNLCDLIETTKAQGKRVIAVGTTSMRALETASKQGKITPYQGETNIFIYPGYQFNCVDVLITNFHLPASTLLILLCAFGGYEEIMHAYREAVENAYRFYSYGDAMWVPRKV